MCYECQQKASIKTVICEKCGKPFTVKKYPGTDSFRKVRFCSNECRLSVPVKYSTCQECGKEFELQRTEDGHFIPHLYCSNECRLKGQKKKLELCNSKRIANMIKTCQKSMV